MNTRKHFEMLVAIGAISPDTGAGIVKKIANDLLLALKKPSERDFCFVNDGQRFEQAGVDPKEPANWAALHCSVKELADSTYLITIDEASPGQCPTLCSYIHDFLKRGGWGTQVVTVTTW